MQNYKIPVGYTLTLTPDASIAGTYGRLAYQEYANNDNPSSFSASTAVALGPFTEERVYQVVVSNGAVSASLAWTNFSNSASPTFTGTVVLPSTTSIGSVSSTEIGYLDNVTSALQTQLNNKHPLVDAIEDASADGAIATDHGIVKITKAGVAALTLAAPALADDGKYINVISLTDNAHTITATSLIINGVTGGPFSTITFAAFAGAGVTLMAMNELWVVTATRAVTVS